MTNALSPQKLARLPKYAQDHIAALEHEVQTLTERLGRGPRDARVYADPNAKTPRWLGDKGPVRFQVTSDPNEWIDVTLNRERGYVEIRASYDLAFTPRSSNSAQLRTLHHSVMEKLDRSVLEDAEIRLLSDKVGAALDERQLIAKRPRAADIVKAEGEED